MTAAEKLVAWIKRASVNSMLGVSTLEEVPIPCGIMQSCPGCGKESMMYRNYAGKLACMSCEHEI